MRFSREIFERHGLRCTAQRIALFEALRASTSHPTAEELYHAVRATTSRLSLATVYNTLEALCKAGICRSIPMGDGATRYDADVTDHLHVRVIPHGGIHDVPVDLGRKLLARLPKDVIRQVEERLGVQIDRVQIELVAREAAQAKSL
jgi:Fe2+ or Zn2+ uptake regulation protein